MKLRPQQIIGLLAILVFGGGLILRLTAPEKEDPLRYAVDTSQVMAEYQEKQRQEALQQAMDLGLASADDIEGLRARLPGDAEDRAYCSIILPMMRRLGHVPEGSQEELRDLTRSTTMRASVEEDIADLGITDTMTSMRVLAEMQGPAMDDADAGTPRLGLAECRAIGDAAIAAQEAGINL